MAWIGFRGLAPVMRGSLAPTLVVIAAALALAACGGSDPATSGEQPTASATATAAASLQVDVADGQPVGGVQELKVSKDTDVRIEVDVDTPQEIHVHGYELEAEATPGEPAVFEFTADIEGIFEVESHAADALLARLVVEP